LSKGPKPGLSVEEVVRRHKRYHYSFKRLHEIFNARITAEPIMELKTAFSLHSYLCSEHVAALRDRVAEMREPPLGLDVVPDIIWRCFSMRFSPRRRRRNCRRLYEKALPALREGMKRHIEDTNVLVDFPSVRVCKFALIEIDEILDFGRKAIERLDAKASQQWTQLLDDCLAAAGGLDGRKAPVVKQLARQHSAKPYVYDKVPRRTSVSLIRLTRE